MTSSPDLPNPLTPADCDLRGLPYMPLAVGRLMDSDLFALSTGDEFKAAVALWCKSWNQTPGGSLPNDERVLEFLSGSKRWKSVRAMALRGWVLCSDGRLYHPLVAENAIAAWESRTEYREKEGNKDDRQKRWRERCKAITAQLRELGVAPPKGAGLELLESLLVDAMEKHSVDGQPSTSASTPPSTVDAGEMPKKGKGELSELKALSGRPDAKEVLDHLNTKAGTAFRYVDANLDLIVARLKRSTVAECKAVIDAKCAEWLHGDQAKYLRPETLFGATKFEQYIGQLGSAGAGGQQPINPAFRGCK